MARTVTAGALVALALVLSGCSDDHSALNPAGPQAAHISHLWHFVTITCTVIFVLVMVVLALAVLRPRREQERAFGDAPETKPDPARERRIGAVVSTCVVVSAAILLTFTVSDYVTGVRIHSLSSNPDPLILKVIGHQWWWEVNYSDPLPSNTVSTANEIHIPVGVPVKVELDSTDVIHSFWAPNLHGKKDLVPGHPTSIWLRADHAGTYQGQCAEFCGYEHALMRFLVVAEPPDQFDSWLRQQRQAALAPIEHDQQRGQQVFMSNSCVLCHTVRGTTAAARLGPDLTHVASRKTLAAGAIPNSRGHLAGWVVDPQRIKPGVRMPQNELKPEDLRSLLEFLESLK